MKNYSLDSQDVSDDIILNKIGLDADIADGISLRRIKRRVLSEIGPCSKRHRFGKMVTVPVLLLLILGSVSAFAYSNNLWDYFFKGSSISGKLEKPFAEKSITASGYKITLHEAAMGSNNGIVLLSLQKADGTVLDRNTQLDIDIPMNEYGSFGSSSTRVLSEDGKTLYYCYFIDGSIPLAASHLNLNVKKIETCSTKELVADFSLEALYSSRYSDILSIPGGKSGGAYVMDPSGIAELNKRVVNAGDLIKMDGIEGIYFITAGFNDNRLHVVTNRKAGDSKISVWMNGLYDSRTGEALEPSSYLELGYSEECGFFGIDRFDYLKEADLRYLYPKITYIKETGVVTGNWNFQIDDFSELQEVNTANGLNPSLPDGVKVEKLSISPIGAYLSISGESTDSYEKFFTNCDASNSYFLLDNGSKIALVNRSSGAGSSEGGFTANVFLGAHDRFGNNTDTRSIFTNTAEINAVYINGALIWKRP